MGQCKVILTWTSNFGPALQILVPLLKPSKANSPPFFSTSTTHHHVSNPPDTYKRNNAASPSKRRYNAEAKSWATSDVLATCGRLCQPSRPWRTRMAALFQILLLWLLAQYPSHCRTIKRDRTLCELGCCSAVFL